MDDYLSHGAIPSEYAQRKAVEQDMKTLRDDIDHLKQKVINTERLYKLEREAHATTQGKIDLIADILDPA